MIDKEDIISILPHILYIFKENGKKIDLYYIGGEIEKNHTRFTIDKKYKVQESFYAENRDDKREPVWICCSDDKDNLCQINLKNFSPYKLKEHRDIKLNKILGV